ncbi:MAG: anthranilate synthase component I [Candidatus Altiarchaeales archaeon]|nr:anthranilate synthase component I [Candidatus Altiarchaeales archaeon]
MIPVYQLVKEVELLELDPMEVYNALGSSFSYILQSAEGGEKIARYSFIGLNPVLYLKIQDNRLSCKKSDKNLNAIKTKSKDPLNALREVMQEFDFKGNPGLRFVGGLVGYLAYDTVRHYVRFSRVSSFHGFSENRKQKTENRLKEPDCEFVLARNNIIFDHVQNKTFVTENYFNASNASMHARNLDKLVEKLLDVEIKPVKQASKLKEMKFTSNLSQSEYEKMVSNAIEYIKAGDIFQVVLSQRLSAECSENPLEVYRRLKKINPSPYMYYLDFDGRKIVGSSPEMLARVEGRNVVTYPIAGTRSRGKTVREDKKLEEEMLADEKEKAEHIMLVDLGRNDIGRIAEHGTVKVKKFMTVEKYSHVQHLVSEVSGKLQKNKDCFDALQSIFPAGTVSGAPKVRAMEIIDELEPSKRGIYAGCIGYFSFNGNMDTAITIRTLVFEGNKVHAQAGAGIVADSKPEYEFKETLKKAGALLKALTAE